MSNELDDELRGALRPVDPGEHFAQRVLARIADESPRLPRPGRPLPAGFRWLPVALVASGVLCALLIHEWRLQGERQGLEARRELIEALQVTSRKLDLAYRVVNDDVAGAGGEDSGA
jgi:hypothetical protein